MVRERVKILKQDGIMDPHVLKEAWRWHGGGIECTRGGGCHWIKQEGFSEETLLRQEGRRVDDET